LATPASISIHYLVVSIYFFERYSYTIITI